MSDAKFVLLGFRDMVKSDLQGGTASIAYLAYDCTVGTFTKQDLLIAGGVSPKMAGDIQIALSDLPAGLDLYLGLPIVVVPNTGKTRQCKLHSTQHAGPLVNILVWDVNEGA